MLTIFAGLFLLGTIGCGGAGDSGFVEFSQLPSQPPIQPETAIASSDNKADTNTASPEVTEPDQPVAAEPSTSETASVASETAVQETPASVTPTPVTPTPEPSTAETGAPETGAPETAASESGEPPAIVATEASASQAAPAGVDGSTPVITGPLEIKLLIPEKLFRPEKNSTAIRVSYDDIDLLKVLNMEPVPVDAVEYFPEWLKSLDGATIRIRGFMYPTFEATGLTGFTLARDNGICCFVRPPKIYDIIAVELAPGVTSDYIEGKPFDVEGTFRIQPESDETDLFRLYRIENARVLR